MVPRYQSSEIGEIFSDKNRLTIFIEIEACFLEELAQKFAIPAHEIKSLRSLKNKIDVSRIEAHEKKTKHEVTAFLNWIWEELPQAKVIQRFLHLGLTSSDILDTALNLQIVLALEIVSRELLASLKILQGLNQKYKKLTVMGRTHGIHAEATTLGLKFLGFCEEGQRNLRRLQRAREEISFGKLSGSVGNFASSVIDPKSEEEILKKLGLKPEPVATQVIPRDRYAYVMAQLTLTAAWIERMATEIRQLERTEVGEIFEPFGKDQEGSSSMPHKRNPILCENLCGLSRLLRSYSQAAFENIALWHERDISHSSVERVIIPDSFHLIHFMLKRFNFVLSGLVVNESRIKENLKILGDLTNSQRYLNALISLGVSRREAYRLVQESSFSALENKTSLYEELKKRKPALKKASEKSHLRFVEDLFKRSQAARQIA